jgi:hypothetical protein
MLAPECGCVPMQALCQYFVVASSAGKLKYLANIQIYQLVSKDCDVFMIS